MKVNIHHFSELCFSDFINDIIQELATYGFIQLELVLLRAVEICMFQLQVASRSNAVPALQPMHLISVVFHASVGFICRKKVVLFHKYPIIPFNNVASVSNDNNNYYVIKYDKTFLLQCSDITIGAWKTQPGLRVFPMAHLPFKSTSVLERRHLYFQQGPEASSSANILLLQLEYCKILNM